MHWRPQAQRAAVVAGMEAAQAEAEMVEAQAALEVADGKRAGVD
eukprot:COSAG01_NODE_5946_length_3940_cov_2.722728_2_plen_44_part_00